MEYFGDVSGHFKGLLNGHCEVVVVGVVRGDRLAAGKCAKKAVRQVEDIPEARWNDMKDVQKRRFFDCLAERDPLEFGYATFTRENLESLSNTYVLYQQDISLDPDWDLALTGYAYGEIMFELDALEERRDPIFQHDRVSAKTQSQAVADHVQAFLPTASVHYTGSRQEPGIQTADCLAGAIAEDFKKETNWEGYLYEEDLTDCKYNSLVQLEHFLEVQSTGP